MTSPEHNSRDNDWAPPIVIASFPSTRLIDLVSWSKVDGSRCKTCMCEISTSSSVESCLLASGWQSMCSLMGAELNFLIWSQHVHAVQMLSVKLVFFSFWGGFELQICLIKPRNHWTDCSGQVELPQVGEQIQRGPMKTGAAAHPGGAWVTEWLSARDVCALCCDISIHGSGTASSTSSTSPVWCRAADSCVVFSWHTYNELRLTKPPPQQNRIRSSGSLQVSGDHLEMRCKGQHQGLELLFSLKWASQWLWCWHQRGSRSICSWVWNKCWSD